MNRRTVLWTAIVGVCFVGMSVAGADPCPCDADVRDDGNIDFNDAAAIMECRNGDCSGCLSSCDINCDGVVDEGDLADDIMYTPSAWLCQFVGGPADRCCTEPLGACCNESTEYCANAQFASSCDNSNQVWVPGVGCPDITCPGVIVTGACCDGSTTICTDDALEDDCTGSSLIWTPGQSCEEVTCMDLPRGACCDPDRGICENETHEPDCGGGNLVWSEDLSCAEVSCITPPVGACCNTGNGYCTDEVFEVDCTGAGLTWYPSTACSSVSCSVPPQDPCPCDADVDNDGIVNIRDAAAIMECREGDCSGCLSSCDVNCDGVVDEGDIADDIIYTPSVWLCQFVGGPPEGCCTEPLGACCHESIEYCANAQFASSCDGSSQTWVPGVGCPDIACPGVIVTGACCDGSTGICTNEVLEDDCTGSNLAWTPAQSCEQVTCDALPRGACCDLSRGICESESLQANCTGATLVWTDGQGCAAVSCPAPPGGACCNIGNGQCQDEAPEVDCAGTGLVWTASTLCEAVSCTVPPQDPCPCDADVRDDGNIDINDAAAIMGCRNGDCSGCLSSCDINCDGVVDEGDIADDIVYTPSAWLCQFVGGSADRCCTEPLGACCNESTESCYNAVFEDACDRSGQRWVQGLGCPDITCPGVTGACCDGSPGVCTNGVLEVDCTNPISTWSPGQTCEQVTCADLPLGACCDPDRGICENETHEPDCGGGNLVWSEGLSCAEVSCIAPPVGACCNTGNGYCTDEVFEVDCTGAGLTWYPSTACASVSCSVPPQDPCPCDADVDTDGIVNIRDAAAIMECREGDCSGCLSSCDVNCDGVVDEDDVADDVFFTPSAWNCQFVGGSADRCCTEPSGACCNTSTAYCANAQFESSCDRTNQTWAPGLGCPDIACPGSCCDTFTGTCTEDVAEDDCTGADLTYLPGQTCAEAVCEGGPATGACCDQVRGICQDEVLQRDCLETGFAWSEGVGCAAVSCTPPPTGACCNTGNGQCADEVFQVDCTGTNLIWTQAATCDSVSCSMPPQDPCMCDADVNNDGIVNLVDAACIAGCKVGACSCCESSCDVNCDGVVDSGDLGDDPINDDSAWACLFFGLAPETCCAVPPVLDTVAPAPNRYLRFKLPEAPVRGLANDAIRITIVSLDGFAVPALNTLWVGAPYAAPEEDIAQPDLTFAAAPLQCAPQFHNWGAMDVVSVYGVELMPGSEYIVQRVSETCADLNDESCYTAGLTVRTGKFGDVVDPFHPDFGQPDFKDISAYVRKFQADPDAPIKSVAQLQGATVDPMEPINFKDIADVVSAFAGISFAEVLGALGPCVCPSSVVCGVTPCTLDDDCIGGLCVQGACADACGRCLP